MAILRKQQRAQYTVIDNTIFRDSTLSNKALGMLCRMLSLPDGWEFSVMGLVALSNDGKSAVMSQLDELEEHGYLMRSQVRVDGKIAGVEYIVSETPMSEKPYAENQHTENQHTENPTLSITNISNTKESNNKRYRFVPPTVEEVQTYINEKGYSVNAQRFVDYYSSKGWTIGKNSPMKNWQAAVRTWEHNSYNKEDKKSSGNPWWDALQNGGF